ncbi:MAG: hypothetical protein VB013_10215 [Anaerolineaceae bacterium]|nr:hypothetical protein [Anaerolineaceae bacterium]
MSSLKLMRKKIVPVLLMLLFLLGLTGHLLETDATHTVSAETVCALHSGCFVSQAEAMDINSTIDVPQIEKAPLSEYSLRVVIPHPPRSS